MWYKKAKPFVESGELAILGVVQEQHAERALLYRQWKQFEFPIVQDATTSLNLAVVPIPILIDEHGIVRKTRARTKDLIKFMEQEFQKDAVEPSKRNRSEATVQIDEGNQLLHRTGDTKSQDIESAIGCFSKALELDSDNGKAMFALGVAHRMRFDSSDSRIEDFEAASTNWSNALATHPNQYIWRRRIQQYGPRLGKPYPFYDWVDDAIADIKKRGETPVELSVRLTGTEIAGPVRAFTAADSAENPDPEAKIRQADSGLIELATSIVPAKVKPGAAVRVHLHMNALKGNWNDEAGSMSVWINESSTGTPEKRLIEFSPDAGADSRGLKNLDFEFQTDDATDKPQVEGFVLFHFCDQQGVCFYCREDFIVKIPNDK